MNKALYIFCLLAGPLFAQDTAIYGSLRLVMQGDLKATLDLKEIAGKEDIYGLGAVENLQGEIIVINSKPYISQVVGNGITMDTTFNYNASLFAFSQITSWVSDTILKAMSNLEIEQVIAKKAIHSKMPLSFLLKGKVQSLDWHVIDWQRGDTVHTHQKHKTAGIHGQIKDEDVVIFGFYSKNHKGILTHRNSNVHMHFINKNKTISGHVDNLILENAVLRLANK